MVKHKALLVARGFLQPEGIGFKEVFALVECMQLVRLLLALAAAMVWRVHHLDGKSAFLNGGLGGGRLRQARKRSTGCANPHRRRTPSSTPPWRSLCSRATPRSTRCSYDDGKEGPIVGVYVDDLIVTGARAHDIDAFKKEIAARFNMSDLGVSLGVRVG